MAIGDPFDTTYAGAYKSGSSLGEGLDSAAGDIADKMKLDNQRKQALGLLKQFGMINTKTEDPSLDDLAQGAKDFVAKTQGPGHELNINYGDNPDQAKQNIMSIYKALNIPMPQGKTKTTLNLTPGTEYDPTKGEVAFKGQSTQLTPEESAARFTRALGVAPQGTTPEVTSKGGVSYKADKPVDTDAEWSKLDKTVNPNVTTNRTPLGMAGRANMAADRAITTLNNPMVTNQEAGNVMADIASIYQGGSPTEFGMSEQGYKTVQGQAAGLMQYLTGKPTDALTPDIKARLQTVLSGMKDTNSKVIKQNLDYVEQAHSKLINSDPDKWKSIRGILEGGYGNASNSSGANQGKTTSGIGYKISQ